MTLTRPAMHRVAVLGLLVSFTLPAPSQARSHLYDAVPIELRARFKARLQSYSRCVVARDVGRLSALLNPRWRAELDRLASEQKRDAGENAADRAEFEVVSLWPTRIERVEGQDATHRITMEMTVRDVGPSAGEPRKTSGVVFAVYEWGDWYFSPLITIDFIL